MPRLEGKLNSRTIERLWKRVVVAMVRARLEVVRARLELVRVAGAVEHDSNSD